MSLHDEYTMTVNVCQELQGLQQKKNECLWALRKFESIIEHD